MKKTILLLVLLITSRSFAQTITFDHTYGLSDYAYGKSIVQLRDSGYVILGNIGQDTGNAAMILIRTDKSGYPVYYKIHNDHVLYDARFLRQASNGDFLITGNMMDESGVYQPFWMRTDTLFEQIWREYLPCDDWAFAYSITELPDENIVIVGETYDTESTGIDALFLKISADGSLLLTKKSGLPQNDSYRSSEIWDNNTLLVAGYRKGPVSSDSIPFFSFIDFTGNEIHTVQYGFFITEAVANQATKDKLGNIVNIGYTSKNEAVTGTDYYFVVCDSIGNLAGYTYHDPAHLPKDDNYISVAIGLNGTIVAGAVTSSLNLRPSAIVHGTSQDYSQMLYSNGRFSDNGDTYLSQIIPTSDNGFVFVGSATTLGTHLTDILVCKMDSTLNSPNPYIQALKIGNSFEPESSVSLYPNPVDNIAYLQSFSSSNSISVISIYNPEMKLLDVFEHNFANSPKLEIPVSHYASGFYIIKIQTNKSIIVKKMIKN